MAVSASMAIERRSTASEVVGIGSAMVYTPPEAGRRERFAPHQVASFPSDA